jgi:hypothetical protein
MQSFYFSSVQLHLFGSDQDHQAWQNDRRRYGVRNVLCYKF